MNMQTVQISTAVAFPLSADFTEVALDKMQLMERLGDDRELLGELVVLFQEDLPGRVAALNGALALRDSALFEQAAHAIKGMVANFATGPAYDKAALLETMARSHDWTNAAGLVQELETHLDKLGRGLTSLVIEISF